MELDEGALLMAYAFMKSWGPTKEKKIDDDNWINEN